MSHEKTLSDIDYLKALAQAGQRSPLLGGPIGIMWSALLIPTLTIHGLTAMGLTGLDISQIGFVWMVFGLTGGVLSFLMSRKLADKKGAQSVGNKIENKVWTVTTALIFSYAIALAVATSLLGAPFILFNTVMALAFALYTMSMATLARLTGEDYLVWAASGSALFMALCTIFIMRPEVYFLAAAGVFLTSLVPSAIEIKRESEYAG